MPMSSPFAARFKSAERLTLACVGERVVTRRYYDDIASNSRATPREAILPRPHRKCPPQCLTRSIYDRVMRKQADRFPPVTSRKLRGRDGREQYRRAQSMFHL